MINRQMVFPFIKNPSNMPCEKRCEVASPECIDWCKKHDIPTREGHKELTTLDRQGKDILL